MQGIFKSSAANNNEKEKISKKLRESLKSYNIKTYFDEDLSSYLIVSSDLLVYKEHFVMIYDRHVEINSDRYKRDRYWKDVVYLTYFLHYTISQHMHMSFSLPSTSQAQHDVFGSVYRRKYVNKASSD